MQLCALCGAAAFLYCDSDVAFLCWACDAAVHGANFLVARHVRLVACNACLSIDADRCVTGAGSPPSTSLCRSCSQPSPPPPPRRAESSSPSSSSRHTAEPSAAPRPAPRRRKCSQKARPRYPHMRAFLELESLSRRMGLRSERGFAATAMRALAACGSAIDALPERVAHVAALWYAIKLFARRKKLGRSSIVEALRRLVARSRVPARLIVMAESKIARAAAHR
ncbi:hypothetical protein Cni_G03710 [Canna indica]|uniref:B box-type domain-containing protein n=1 Tax=Canna indica TaxID=4628 RepID=A0AAQ3Q3B1_9LILI|nr:hypothetical protein Cni_G03710 [Canna indica]